jgi:hypothetical protein
MIIIMIIIIIILYYHYDWLIIIMIMIIIMIIITSKWVSVWLRYWQWQLSIFYQKSLSEWDHWLSVGADTPWYATKWKLSRHIKHISSCVMCWAVNLKYFGSINANVDFPTHNFIINVHIRQNFNKNGKFSQTWPMANMA